MKSNKNDITINAKLIRETDDGIFLDCEGDKVWFSKRHIKFDREEEAVTIPEWIYKQKFPNG